MRADRPIPDTLLASAPGAAARPTRRWPRQVWLPAPLYGAIPWIYLCSGSLSLLGGLYLPDWAWPLPYAVLFAVACLHTGLRIATMRQKARQPQTKPIGERST